jgi:hypothetical protein
MITIVSRDVPKEKRVMADIKKFLLENDLGNIYFLKIFNVVWCILICIGIGYLVLVTLYLEQNNLFLILRAVCSLHDNKHRLAAQRTGQSQNDIKL